MKIIDDSKMPPGMAVAGDWSLFARDPRCTCPELTFTSGPTGEDIRKCRERSPWLHRVIGADELAELRKSYEEAQG